MSNYQLKKKSQSAKNKKYKLSNDFFKFETKYNLNLFLNSQKKNKWFFRNGNKVYIYGPKGHKFFLKNENKLNPINKNLFISLGKKKQIPIIMNFYEDIKHKSLKKKHLSVINQKKNLDFLLHLENSIDEYLEKILNKKINLIEEISKLIIKTHTSLFQSINLNDKDLSELYFYKDYYTMGMYLPKKKLIKYYENKKFLKSEKKFINIYKKNTKIKNSNNYKTDLYEISNFYNYTIAGSTNIAKALSYILSLILENYKNIEKLIIKKKDMSVEKLSSYLVYEFYRFIPLVNNQLISPFLYREINKDIFYKNKIFLKRNENLWFFNSINFFDPNIYKSPYSFNPFRWKNKKLKLPYNIFGAGSHYCCGSYFAEKWLQSLLKKILLNYKITYHESLKYKKYNQSIENIFKTILYVKIDKN